MATLQQLAELVGGQVSGDGSQVIETLAPIDQAGEGAITFLANPKYLVKVKDCTASAIIVAPGVEIPGRNLLVCGNPYLAFAKVLTFLTESPVKTLGVMDGAHVAESAQVAEGTSIYPGCIIGERVKIGAGTILYPGVILYDDVQVGENCLLHAGAIVREQCQLGNNVILQPAAVIGSDGFGFAPDGHKYFKIPQVGIVVLEDDVEIGACCCIDRAALGVTRIRRGTKLDNLVQIAHNVDIGEDTVIAGQVGIAGSSKVGHHCTFGGQAAAAGHIKIGDNVTIAGRGGATNNVESNQVMAGLPLMPHKEWLKASMGFTKLPEMRKEIKSLKKRLEQLETLLKED